LIAIVLIGNVARVFRAISLRSITWKLSPRERTISLLFCVSTRRKSMVLGMSIATFTLLHVIISLIGIASGLLVMFGLLNGKRLGAMTSIFLVTTVLTSVTGFLFPVTHLLPSHVVGILSLLVLAIAIPALYVFHLSGAWRKTYVITAAIALYFNCFVLVVQSFQKIPALHALAPAGKEPPFAIAQLALLLAFIVLTIFAAKNFRSAEAARATSA
jgi:hypothetical protein